MPSQKPTCPISHGTVPATQGDMAGEHERLLEALHASEERHRAILDTAVNAIITMTEQCIIDGVNASAERLFGYTREEMIGKNIKLLMPSPFREQHDNFVQRYIETGEKRIIGIGREVMAQRKDGSVFPIDLSVGEVNLPHGRLFTGIIRDISDRKHLEEKILDISESEQHRIGQDIHDDLCQQLAAIGCLAKVATQNLSRSAHPETESLAEIVRLVTQANARAREMSRGLVPVVLDSGGLMSALEDLARSTERIFRITCRFTSNPPVQVSSNKVATQLYRIAQEAVANAVKHSQADRLELDLSRQGDQIVLTIKDNGRGFVIPAGQTSQGLGLLTMTHRAQMLGGKVNLHPEAGGGITVVCMVPIPHHPDPSTAPA